MSATRLVWSILKTTPLQTLRFQTLSSLSLLPITTKPLYPKTLKPFLISYNNYSVSATSTITSETTFENPTTAIQDNHHPWPEWITFVDHLRSQGYYTETETETNGGGPELLYREMNLLKDPCLSFARDRYDIFGSLPKGDIQIIVERGCPKLYRKVVNSAKRLRLYVGLSEQDVCSACSLQRSCDRANVILKESEGVARTLDLMRLLLFIALDPLVISGAARPLGIEQAESSARRLLSMFVDLSVASPSPPPVEHSEAAFYQKKQSVKSTDPVRSSKNELRQGDWRCPKCNFVNYSRNLRCKSCNEGNPGKAGSVKNEVKAGDWICPECNFVNFSKNVQCRKCKAEGPKQGSAHGAQMKKGDWNCSQCGIMNFASRKNCFSCREPRPPRTLNPGDWECPKCDFLNFRRNSTCLKCGNEHSKEAVVQPEDHYWRRPSNLVV